MVMVLLICMGGLFNNASANTLQDRINTFKSEEMKMTSTIFDSTIKGRKLDQSKQQLLDFYFVACNGGATIPEKLVLDVNNAIIELVYKIPNNIINDSIKLFHMKNKLLVELIKAGNSLDVSNYTTGSQYMFDYINLKTKTIKQFKM